MRREHDPLASHIFVSRRDHQNTSDTKSGKRHERAARMTWQKACELGFRGDLEEWERLLNSYSPALIRNDPRTLQGPTCQAIGSRLRWRRITKETGLHETEHHPASSSPVECERSAPRVISLRFPVYLRASPLSEERCKSAPIHLEGCNVASRRFQDIKEVTISRSRRIDRAGRINSLGR